MVTHSIHVHTAARKSTADTPKDHKQAKPSCTLDGSLIRLIRDLSTKSSKFEQSITWHMLWAYVVNATGGEKTP